MLGFALMLMVIYATAASPHGPALVVLSASSLKNKIKEEFEAF